MTESDSKHKNGLVFGQKVPFRKTEGGAYLKSLGMMAGGIPIGAAGIVAQEVTGSREVGMLAIDAMMGYYLLTFLVGVGLGWRQHRARARFAGRQLSYLDSGNSVKEARPD